MKRTCVQCGKEFEISQSEIAFFRKKKLSLPKRCKECRDMNKQKKNGENREEAGQGAKQENRQEPVQEPDKRQLPHRREQTISRDDRMEHVMESKTTQSQIEERDSASPKKKMDTRQKIAYLAAALLIGLGGGGAALGSMNNAEPVQVSQEQISETEESIQRETVEINQEETVESDQEETAEINREESAEIDQEESAENRQEEEIQSESTEDQQEITIVYEFRNEELFENHYKKHGIEMGFASREEYLAGANRVIASPDVLKKIEAEDGDYVYYLEETNEFVVVSTDGYLRTYFQPSDGIEYYNRQ